MANDGTTIAQGRIRSEARGPHWVAWIADAKGKPEKSVVLVGETHEEAEHAREGGVGSARENVAARYSSDLFVFVELRRITQAQDLPGGVTRENAVRSLGFERHDSHVPRTRPVCGRDTPARQALERLELEHRRCRLDVIQRPTRNCHTAPPVAGAPPMQSQRQLSV